MSAVPPINVSIAHVQMFEATEKEPERLDIPEVSPDVPRSPTVDPESCQTDKERYEALMEVLAKLNEEYVANLKSKGYQDWESIQFLFQEEDENEIKAIVGFDENKVYHHKKFLKTFEKLNTHLVSYPEDPLDAMEIECKCGSILKRTLIENTYDDAKTEDERSNVLCDGCFENIPMKDSSCFHCCGGKNSVHRGGFDYCLSCAKQELGLEVRTNLKFVRPLGLLDVLNFTMIEHKRLQVFQKLHELLDILNPGDRKEEEFNVTFDSMMHSERVSGIDIAAHMFAGMETEQERQRAYERKTGLFWSRIAGRDTAAIVMLGKSGVGKSTVCNRLAGDETLKGDSKFKTSSDLEGCTKQPVFIHMFDVRSGNVTAVVDLPGLEDPKEGNALFVKSVIDFFSQFPDGKKIFAMVHSVHDPRFDTVTQHHLEIAEALFGNLFWRHLVIIVNHVDLSDQPGTPTGQQAELVELSKTRAVGLNRQLHEDFKVDESITIPVVAIGRFNFVDAVQELNELAAEADVFEHDLLRTLKQMKQSGSAVEQAVLRDECIANVRRLVIEYEERTNREIESRILMDVIEQAEGSVKAEKPRNLPKPGVSAVDVPPAVVDSRVTQKRLERRIERADELVQCAIL